MRSLGLRGRLMLAVGVVVVVAIAAVGWVAERATRTEFLKFLDVEEAARAGDGPGADPQALAAPLEAALAEGGWNRVSERLARRFEMAEGEQAVVLGADDRVLAASRPEASELAFETRADGDLVIRHTGGSGHSEVFQLRLPHAELGGAGPPGSGLRDSRPGDIGAEATPGDRIPRAGTPGEGAARLFVLPILGAAEDVGPPPRDVFLGSVSRWILGAVLAAGLLALAITLVVTRQVLAPVGELTRAADELAAGRLDRRVTPRSDDEIGRLTRAFNTMAEAIERNEALRRDMVSDTAHELRTPITNLRCQIEALEDGVLEPGPQVLASLHEEIQALQTLVDDLQQLALAEARQLAMEIEPVDVGAEIARAVRAFQQARGETPAISTRAAELPPAAADRRRLQQVLANLLANAAAHTPPDGEIRVRAEAHGEAIRLSVEDDGPGLPPDQLERVFERYYRTDASRQRATGGSGLGLTIVRRLVEAQGGRIWAECPPGQGAAFRFTIPRA